MGLDRSTVMRHVWTAVGCAALLTALALLARQQLVMGFLAAFGGFSWISVGQSGLDYHERYTARNFMGSMSGRIPITTLGRFCSMASFLCLAAAGISWLALR